MGSFFSETSSLSYPDAYKSRMLRLWFTAEHACVTKMSQTSPVPATAGPELIS
jgi:hypothetical protein